MSKQVEGQFATFRAAEALEAFRRVKLDSNGELVYADAKEPAIGITQDAVADDEVCSVRLLNGPGTFKMTCSAAVAARVPVYGTADGKIDDTGGGVPLGVSLEAGSGDGGIIEVLPIPSSHGLRTVAGQHTTVAASDTIVTGLAVVVAVVAQLDDDPVDGAMHVTSSIGDQAGTPAAGSILIKSWKSTDGDATLIAGTTFGKKVNYIAVGY